MSTVTTERNQPETYRGDHGWRALAACAGTGTDTFFVPDEMRGKPKDRWVQRAKAICNTCTVRAECIAYAAEWPERYGIFGGLTEQERGYGNHSGRKKGKR